MNQPPMITVKDRNLNEIGQLENAFQVHPTIKVNKVWAASFSLPGNDSKNDLCNHFNFIDITSRSGRNKGLYRIMPTQTEKNSSTNTITYNCEHAISTLMDDVMEGQHVFTDMTTRQVLQAILNLQSIKHWELGVVEFDNFLNYAFEDENSLLGPIFEVPKTFIEPYIFTYDTDVYPFKLNLLKASDDVVGEMRWGKDMGDFNKVADPTDIINYLIPKGEGEGVNKLTIEDINGGKKYLLDQDSINKWGKHSRIWIDQRFLDKKTLKARGEVILAQNKDPKISLTAKAYDLSIKEEYQGTERVINGLTDLIVEDEVYQVRILEEDIPDLAREWDVEYQLGNRADNSATANADLRRKIEVNNSYSAGATNIDSYTFNDNADPDFPAIIEFPFPADMINVNDSKLRIKTSKYRVPMRGMKAGGYYQKASTVQSKSTASGGGQTTSSGGGSSTTSGQSNGYAVSLLPLASTGPFTALIEDYKEHVHSVTLNMADLDHWHIVDIEPHTHKVNDHTHNFEVTIPAIEIQEHTHEQIYGIYEHNSLPTQLTIKVDGVTVSFNGIEGEIDITNHLRKDSNGKVTRDYHTIEVTPNDLARLSLIVSNRFFIRSHIGVTL